MRLIFGILLLFFISQAKESRPTIIGDDRGFEILKRAYDYLDSLESFSIDAILENEDTYRGKMVIAVRNRVHIDLDRANNRLMVEIDGDSKNRVYSLDKGNFIILDRDYGLYGTLNTPPKIDDALDFLFDKYQISSPLANLLYSNLSERLMPKARVFYFGKVEMDGKSCDHIGFFNKNRELQVWVQKGEKPLILKFILIDKTSPFRLHSEADIRWNLDGVDEVTFKIPENFERVPVLNKDKR